ELRAMGNRHVAIGLAVAVVGFGGFFAVYSYLVPILTNVTGLSEASTTLVLALYGVGMTLGTLVAGPLTDRALRPTLYAGLALLAAALVTFSFTVHSTWPALVTITFIGALGSFITTPVQMLLMAKAKEAPTMAAASNHSAFNLANAGGAWLGGLALSAGWGWTSPALVGAALAVAGLGLAVTGGLMNRDGRRSEVITASGAVAPAAADRVPPAHSADRPAGRRPGDPARAGPRGSPGQARAQAGAGAAGQLPSCCRRTISVIQTGANGDVQPGDVG